MTHQRCPFCREGVTDLDPEKIYREVTSWVTGPKLDSPKLREQSGRVAHKKCVENQAAGQAPDQPSLAAFLGEEDTSDNSSSTSTSSQPPVSSADEGSVAVASDGPPISSWSPMPYELGNSHG